jgi:Xaa-Pro aminopeptidase
MAKYSRLLVAVDGSETSLHALREAFKLTGSWVTVVAVAPFYEGDLTLVGVPGAERVMREPCDTALARAQELAQAAGAVIQPVCQRGEPHARLVELAETGSRDLIVMGAKVDGYCADISRTFVLGPPDEQFRRIYALVRRAQVRAEQELRAGLDSLAGDALAREVIAGAGYGEAFGHSLGHGVGLAVHEAPSLSPSEERRTILPAGCIVTVEPGIYLTGWGGVRLEDMVLLTADGAEVLNGHKDFYEW